MSMQTDQTVTGGSFPANREVRSRARLSLLGHYTPVILATFCAALLGWVAGLLFSFEGHDTFSTVLAALSTFLLGVLALMLDGGFSYLYLRLVRQRPIKLTDIFFCFKVHPDHALRLALMYALANLVADLPLLVPVFWPSSRNQLVLQIVLRILWIILFAWINLTYGLSFFLFADEPTLSCVPLMQKSRRLMQGHRIRLAGLILSFAGYALLGILSLGIGFLWISPYLHTSIAHFYLEAAARATR